MGELRVKDWVKPKFTHGDRATCIVCGVVIYFVGAKSSYDGDIVRGVWHEESQRRYDPWNSEDHDRMKTECDHMPKEFCNARTASWDFCGNPVKYEDQVGEVYACGHHRAKFLEEARERERRRARDAQREVERQLTEFESEKYTEAAQWFRDVGLELVVKGYNPRRYSGSVVRSNDVDIYNLMIALKEKFYGEVLCDEDDTWAVDADPVQVHPFES